MKCWMLLLVVSIIKLAVPAEPGPPVTRIEYCYISPEIAPGSFGLKPKVLYRAGAAYSRSEEQPDPALRLHQLIICAEPDIWMINLIGRTGQHIVDPGPTYIIHHNILSRDAPREFLPLEFGKELEFFGHATSGKAQSLDGQLCKVSEVAHADYRVVLYTRTDTQKPFHLDIYKGANRIEAIRYLSYQTGIPFDPALFVPPAGVTITAK